MKRIVVVGLFIASVLPTLVFADNAPSCSLTSPPPAHITAGYPARIIWVTQNANTAIIDQGVGQVQIGSSYRDVYPSVNTTYTMSVGNQYGSRTCGALVTVSQPQSILYYPSSAPVFTTNQIVYSSVIVPVTQSTHVVTYNSSFSLIPAVSISSHSDVIWIDDRVPSGTRGSSGGAEYYTSEPYVAGYNPAFDTRLGPSHDGIVEEHSGPAYVAGYNPGYDDRRLISSDDHDFHPLAVSPDWHPDLPVGADFEVHNPIIDRDGDIIGYDVHTGVRGFDSDLVNPHVAETYYLHPGDGTPTFVEPGGRSPFPIDRTTEPSDE